MPNSAPDPAFETLLEFLRDNRGFDFTGYKRASLMRRVQARMTTVEVEDFAAYQEFLELHPQEFEPLFNHILINVTDFFRDQHAWDVLTRDYLPDILERVGKTGSLRIWSAGCATGQEPYTLAMILAEAMGREQVERQVKIYATDADEEALNRARAGQYTAREMENVPGALRERYFLPLGDQWVFSPDLRRTVIFGRHDLTRDAPISHLDLLVCRNLLMYFNSEAQHRILTRFHFGMEDDGMLFLGRAEMLRAHATLFSPVDLKHRLFKKVPRIGLRDRLMGLVRNDAGFAESRNRVAAQFRVRGAALEAHPVPSIAVDAGGTLVHANHAARLAFGLSTVDVGRPVQDLTLSYRPLELRSRIEVVLAERRAIRVENVEWPSLDGELRNLDVQLYPLLEEGTALVGVGISFADVTHYYRLQAELMDANQELETAFEELQSTNEELETTNEELQSTIEELETTNEELQSTNEELETMNEELQSTNEELETTNDELQMRTGELREVNTYLVSILGSVNVAVVVLDRSQVVRAWNRQAEELWGVRADEVVGGVFQNLDIGLPVASLKGPVRDCIDTGERHQELMVEAVNRRGRPIKCRVTCAPFVSGGPEVRGAVLLMEEWGPSSGQGNGQGT
jgi:two-component system, chemotaxis family, CheB/CheR fusion protein